MRSSLSLLSVFALLLARVAAWPWPDSSDSAPQAGEMRLRVREDSKSDASSQSSSTDSSSPSTTAKASRSDAKSDGSASSTSGSKSSGKSQSATKTTKGPSHTTYDPRLPAGGLSMITPNALLAASQYYKIGDWVTFAWNYTSVSSYPTAVDVLASCSANQATYTIALNQTVDTSANATQKILWDTGAFQSSASVSLLTNQYTLIVYDAASSISATPQAGYFAVADSFHFGMYTPQAYTPLASGWQCAVCNGAASLERQTFSALLGMSAITVLTFTYFANSFGVL